MPANILVVEDESSIRELLTMVLERAGFNVISCSNADKGYQIAVEDPPDLILLDWMLPGESGIKLARRLKIRASGTTPAAPIIMLTARGDEDDKVLGLEAGADDYITKPFSPKELVARVRAVLRRVAPMAAEETLEFQGLELDPLARSVTAGGALISLGPTEYRLLHFFLTHLERVYSRGQLLDSVWGLNVYVEERTVDVHIRRLRKALSASGHDRYVQTVRGAGYKLSTKV